MNNDTLEREAGVIDERVTIRINNHEPLFSRDVVAILTAIEAAAVQDHVFGADAEIRIEKIETGSLTLVLGFMAKHVEKAAASAALVIAIAAIFRGSPLSDDLADMIERSDVREVIIVTEEERIWLKKDPISGTLNHKSRSSPDFAPWELPKKQREDGIKEAIAIVRNARENDSPFYVNGRFLEGPDGSLEFVSIEKALFVPNVSAEIADDITLGERVRIYAIPSIAYRSGRIIIDVLDIQRFESGRGS